MAYYSFVYNFTFVIICTSVNSKEITKKKKSWKAVQCLMPTATSTSNTFRKGLAS